MVVSEALLKAGLTQPGITVLGKNGTGTTSVIIDISGSLQNLIHS